MLRVQDHQLCCRKTLPPLPETASHWQPNFASLWVSGENTTLIQFMIQWGGSSEMWHVARSLDPWIWCLSTQAHLALRTWSSLVLLLPLYFWSFHWFYCFWTSPRDLHPPGLYSCRSALPSAHCLSVWSLPSSHWQLPSRSPAQTSSQSSRAKCQNSSRTCLSFSDFLPEAWKSKYKTKLTALTTRLVPLVVFILGMSLFMESPNVGKPGSLLSHNLQAHAKPDAEFCQFYLQSVSHFLFSFPMALVSLAPTPPPLSHPPLRQQDSFLNTHFISNTCHKSCWQIQPPLSVMTFYFSLPSFLLSLS